MNVQNNVIYTPVVDFIRRLQCSLQKKYNMHDHLYTS